MELEFSVAIAATAMVAAFLIDWPRAVAGLILGTICRYFPYGTILVPVGVALTSAGAELLDPLLGHTPAEHVFGFLIGMFAVAGTASSLFITIRNLKDRL